MDNLRQLEILWILAIQALGTWLTEPMRIVTLLGNEEFYLLIMPILYWSVDPRLGIRVAILLLLSNGLASVAKVLFHAPRPYWFDQRILALSTESTFGIPSGHAQNAVAIWGLIGIVAYRKGVKIGLILLIGLIGLIGFSRIYLGVHFISDVFLGLLLGGLLLWGFIRVDKPLTAWLRARSLRQMLALSLISSLLLGLIILLPVFVYRNWQIPDLWIANAMAANPEGEIDPLNVNGAFTASGTWLGMMVGVSWLYHRQGGYQVSPKPFQRILCYLVGITGIFVFWYVLGEVFPRSPDVPSYFLRYLRYTMIGLWVSVLAPLLFQRLGLNYPIQSRN